MALIFISHSSKDSEPVKKYKEQITEYGFESVFLDFDEKDGIQINELWEERLYKELNKTKIVLCLVSKNWIDSCWCQKEYSLAKTLNKETILVSIEEDPKHKKEVFQWIGEHVQQIDVANNPQAFKEVLKHIDELTRKVFDKPYAWDETKNPYPGLEPFTEEMAAVFYGREEETDAIIAKLNEPKSLASVHALLIVGASGMGKSSLLRAGILPKLKTFEKYRKKWHTLPTMRPGREPLGKLLRSLVHEAFTESEEAAESYERIREDLKTGRFEEPQKVLDRILLKHPQKKILLPIDQAEEFFTISTKEEKELFFKLLSWVFEHRDAFYTIWTIRSDRIEKFQTDASLRAVRHFHDTYLLTPIAKEHITTIIKYPAYKSNIIIEESLIERMRQDLDDPKALPLLAYTLNELTKGFFEGDARERDKVVKLQDYLALAKEGDNPIYAIIERKIEALLAQPEKIDASLERAKLLEATKNLFLYHLIEIDIDGKANKKIALRAELSPIMQNIADAFVRERLIVSDTQKREEDGNDAVSTYEIAHESIIHNWSLLQNWINEEKEFFITRVQVRVALREWEKTDKKENAYLTGILLEKAQSFIDKPWSDEEKKYILLSIGNKQKIDSRRRQFIVGGFLSLTSLAGFGGYEFLQAKNKKKLKNELDKANYYLTVALVEKAKNALQKEEIPLANLYAYAALGRMSKKYDMYNSIPEVKYIILNHDDSAISSLIGHKDSVNSVAYSPDGKQIVSGSWDGAIKIWDVKNRQELATLKGHKDSVWSVAYSPDGKRIVSASRDGTIKIWDAISYQEIATLKGHKRPVWSVAYSPDGKRIISGSGDNTIKIWDAKSHQELATLKGHERSVNSVAYSPDGRRIVSGSKDKTIRIWDAESYQELATLKGHKRPVLSVAYSPDGRRIVSGSKDKTIRIWDAKSHQELATLKGHESSVYSVAYSPDGKRIVSASRDGTIKIWDAISYQEIATLKGHKGPVWSVAYSPDGKQIVSASLDKTIKIWDAKNRQEIATLKGHKSIVKSVAYSPDGKQIVSGSWDGAIKIWDVKNRQEIATLMGHKGIVKSVAYSPDGKQIVSGSDDKTIMIWDAISYQEIATLKGHKRSVDSVAYSPDGKQIVSGSDDKTIKIWDAKNRQELATLKGHKSFVSSVAYSPDGRRIISGSGDNTIKIWDAKNHKEITTLKGHKDAVSSVAYSPDGRRIISSSLDKTIKIWDAISYQEIATLKGHKGPVWSVAYSPDGKQIVSASLDKTIKIWDAKSHQEIATLKGHKKSVWSVTYSPDGKRIVSGSWDGTIKIWDAAYIMQKYYSLDDPKYIQQNIKRLEQFLQVKLDGIVLKNAVIPPSSGQKV